MTKPFKIEGLNVECTFDYKGGSKEIKDIMPNISKHEDYVKQYIGIWRVMMDKVVELNAQSVLEF